MNTVRDCSNGSRRVMQGSRAHANAFGHTYDFVLGVCETPVESGACPCYLYRPVPDAATPTVEDIRWWLSFTVEKIDVGNRLLVHCEAGQNRSAIVAALILTVWARGNIDFWDATVKRLHEEFLLCNPSHNWMPYAHWDAAIRAYLKEGTV